jgi:hypothetical protein
MDIYISMGHVASGVHHCRVKYIYRESGGIATPYQLANLPTNAHFAARGTSPAPCLPPPCGPLSTGQFPPPPTNTPRGPLPAPCPPGMVPPSGPRTLGLAPRARARAAPLQLSTGPSAGAANSPAAPTGAPCPLPWGAEHRRPPPRPGLGDRGPPVARGGVGAGAPGGPTARATLPGPPP